MSTHCPIAVLGAISPAKAVEYRNTGTCMMDVALNIDTHCEALNAAKSTSADERTRFTS